jgi:hypothetical protein
LTRGEVRLSQESERRAVVAEASAPAQAPLPPDVKPLYERAKEAFDKGDMKNAKAFLMLVTRRTSHPTVQALARDLLEAERAQLRRR